MVAEVLALRRAPTLETEPVKTAGLPRKPWRRCPSGGGSLGQLVPSAMVPWTQAGEERVRWTPTEAHFLLIRSVRKLACLWQPPWADDRDSPGPGPCP
jgi:hypothetical protein